MVFPKYKSPFLDLRYTELFYYFCLFFSMKRWSSVKSINETWKTGKTVKNQKKQETKKQPSRRKLMHLLAKKCSTQNYLARTIFEAKSGNAITTVAARVREVGGSLLLFEMNLQRKVWNTLSWCYSPTRSLDTCT